MARAFKPSTPRYVHTSRPTEAVIVEDRIFIHQCEYCGQQAKYDAMTKMGSRAYVCMFHFNSYCTKTKAFNLDELRRKYLNET